MRIQRTIMKSQLHQLYFLTKAGAVFAFEWPSFLYLTIMEDGGYFVIGGGSSGGGSCSRCNRIVIGDGYTAVDEL